LEGGIIEGGKAVEGGVFEVGERIVWMWRWGWLGSWWSMWIGRVDGELERKDAEREWVSCSSVFFGGTAGDVGRFGEVILKGYEERRRVE
jgi:hypothetical protein